MGKDQGLGGIFDIGDSCDGIVRFYGWTINLTADDNSYRCNTGADAGWEISCHIGLTKYPDADYSCLELKELPKNANWDANDVKHWCSNQMSQYGEKARILELQDRLKEWLQEL